MKALLFISLLLATPVWAKDTYQKVWCSVLAGFWEHDAFNYDSSKKLYEDTSRWVDKYRDNGPAHSQLQSAYPLTNSVANNPVYFEEGPEFTKKYGHLTPSGRNSGRLYTFNFELIDFKYAKLKRSLNAQHCIVVEDPDRVEDLFKKYDTSSIEKTLTPGAIADERREYVRTHSYCKQVWVDQDIFKPVMVCEPSFEQYFTSVRYQREQEIRAKQDSYNTWLDKQREEDHREERRREQRASQVQPEPAYQKEINDLKKKLEELQRKLDEKDNEQDFDNVYSDKPKAKRPISNHKYNLDTNGNRKVFEPYDRPESEGATGGPSEPETLTSFIKRTGITKLPTFNAPHVNTSGTGTETICSVDGRNKLRLVTANVGKKYGWDDEGTETAFADFIKSDITNPTYLKHLIDSGRLNDVLSKYKCGYTYHDDTLNAFRDEINKVQCQRF